jgi:alkanesulfonate monooxygenase SsuD/methylene tetrahydromethanopterin reductase-like flavin-dependent oxidoreductase (luciferase family)
MIGSNGPRMLRIATPHVQAWNSWFADIGNAPSGIATLRAVVDDACRDVGRDRNEIERTVAVLVSLPGGTGRIQGNYAEAAPPPLEGSPDLMAETLRAYAREGISHVQLVIDPIAHDAVEAFTPVLALLDG